MVKGVNGRKVLVAWLARERKRVVGRSFFLGPSSSSFLEFRRGDGPTVTLMGIRERNSCWFMCPRARGDLRIRVN